MPAGLLQFRTKNDRLKEEQASELRRLVLTVPGLPERPVSEILATIDGATAAKEGWTFVMLSPAANAQVVTWLVQNSERPQVAVQLWALLFTALRTDTGEVVLTRDEMAEKLGVPPNEVSRIMTELEGMGAISRRRERVAGMRGPGLVRYFMNPRVGTHLAGKAREKAQERAPLLEAIEGGKRP